MANITDSTDFIGGEIGQAHGYGVAHAGIMPANQVVINDSGLAKDGSGRYKASGTFGVHLAVAPPAGVTVVVDLTVAVNPSSGVTVSPGSLSFTSGNFSADQTVTVTGSGAQVDSGIKAHVRGGGSVDADLLVTG